MTKPIASLADLTPDPRNARRHNPRNVGMIEQALHTVGAARSIVIDEGGVVLAGNATIEAAAQAGIERVRVVEADGNELIAVQRRGLTDEQKAQLALYDNRAAELADWDPAVLAGLADEMDLSGLFSDEELAAVLAEAQQVEPGGGGDEFDPTPQEGPTRTHVGDLWQIGVHRLIVGDCTDPAVVARLMGGERASAMMTDPPYAVDYVGKARDMHQRGYGHSRATLSAAIEGDEIDEKSAAGLWVTAFLVARDHSLGDHAAWYVWHGAGRATRTMLNILSEIGILHHQTIIWVKNNFVIGRCDYQGQHEPCFYGWKQGYRPPFYGPKNQTTVWEVSRDLNPDHPTQKPLALYDSALLNHTKPGDILYDCFAGSGSALIAAHRQNRRARLCEVSPARADVILRRAGAEGLVCERVD